MQAQFSCKWFGFSVMLFQRDFCMGDYCAYSFYAFCTWRGNRHSRGVSLKWDDSDNRTVTLRRETNGKFEGWYVRSPIGRL